MQNKKLYYGFCNHWTEGGIGLAFPSGWYNKKFYKSAFSSIYTIEKMLDATDEYPGLVSGIDLDAYAYEEVLRESPETIDRLKKYIRAGKVSIEGGTYGQPLGQDYGGESNIRQLIFGKKVIKDITGYNTKTFIVEEQWFHPQMPQILMKSGFNYASLQCQNSGQVQPFMDKEIINWKGIDGTKIPTIPINDFMISCVRQYKNYDEYLNIADKYKVPFLFQWVEVWVPGMDWGASAKPFDIGLKQIKNEGAEFVSLDNYMNEVANKENWEEHFIPLENSNYGNNWYQGGGWGYDGDKVISEDIKTEAKLIFLESYQAWRKFYYPEFKVKNLDRYWKKILFLQNHDFSVARNYRAVTKTGMITEAGYLAIEEYKKLQNNLDEIIKETHFEENSTGKYIVVFNFDAVTTEKPVKIKAQNLPKNFILKHDGKEIFYDIDNGYLLFNLNKISGFGATYVEIVECANKVETEFVLVEEIVDDTYNISWIPNTWDIEIYNKKTNEKVVFTAFSGKVGKANEHNTFNHALSPAHQIFTFAFDGLVHCYDQTSLMRIKKEFVKKGRTESTLRLYCDLLTLHTTETPVAFAQVDLTVNHESKIIECKPYIYTGVPLVINATSNFSAKGNDFKITRDYPFGEEITNHTDTYTNSFVRVENSKTHFGIVNYGNQKININKNNEECKISTLISREKLFGAYSWRFDFKFGIDVPVNTYRFVRTARSEICAYRTNILPKTLEKFYDVDTNEIAETAFYYDDDKKYHVLRMVNYSNHSVKNNLVISDKVIEAYETDFYGNKTSQNLKIIYETNNQESKINVEFKPWEIKTVYFK